MDWGDFPPRNIDNLKSLADPQFPPIIGSFVYESGQSNMAASTAVYQGTDYVTVSATINSNV